MSNATKESLALAGAQFWYGGSVLCGVLEQSEWCGLYWFVSDECRMLTRLDVVNPC
jgi:hypothetical protein